MTEKKNSDGSPEASIEDNDEIMTSSTSIVIDLDRLAETAPKPREELPPMQSRPMERVTFSNLEALVPEKLKVPSAEELVEKAPQKVTPPSDAVSVHEVKPPSLFRFVLFGILIVAFALSLFVGWRMNWQWSQILDDPNSTIRIVLKGAPSADAPSPKGNPNTPAQIAPETGHLEFDDFNVENDETGSFVVGVIRNGSNRIHRSISISVRLFDGNQQRFFFKEVPCCTPDRPSAVLKPGESVSFRTPVELRGRQAATVKVTAEKKFSMTDIPE